MGSDARGAGLDSAKPKALRIRQVQQQSSATPADTSPQREQARSEVRRYYRVPWRLPGEDVSHLHLGFWDNSHPHDSLRLAQERCLEQLFESPRIAQNQSILDLGCGPGAGALWLTERTGARVVGIDLLDHHVHSAKRAAQHRGLAGQTEFHQGDIQELELAPRTFHHIMSLECLHHCPNRHAIFKCIARWLRPGGSVRLSELILSSDAGSAARSLVNLSAGSRYMGPLRDYLDALRGAGLQVEQVRNVTHETVIGTWQWSRREHHHTVREHAYRTDGFAGRLLAAPILALSSAAAARGTWGLYFITARKRSAE